MIEARKTPRFERWFARQVRARLAAEFGAVRVRGLDAFADAAQAGPVLVVAHHTAWWDSMLAIALVTGVLRLDGYALMEAASLRRFPFLGRAGGFGVERDRPGDGERAIAYGAARLDRPGRVVWVYPQGRETPAGRRPLSFKRGAAAMLLQSAAAGPNVRWVPVAVAYVYGPEPRATAWVSFGAPVAPPPGPPSGPLAGLVAAEQARAVEAELARVDAAAAEWVETGRAPDDFPAIVTGRRDRLGELLAACLAWLTRRALFRRRPPPLADGPP